MAPLSHIEIEGYRSIRKLRLELKALNVLIGANGSGKSNLIGALGLLGDIVDQRLQLHVAEKGGASARLHFGPKKTKSLRLCARFGPREYEVQLVHVAGDAFVFAKEQSVFHRDDESGSPIVTLSGDQGDKESGLDPGFGPSEPAWHVIEAVRGWKVFQFHDTSKTAGLKQKHQISDNRALQPDGANLAALLYGMKQRAPRKYREVVDAIRAIPLGKTCIEILRRRQEENAEHPLFPSGDGGFAFPGLDSEGKVGPIGDLRQQVHEGSKHTRFPAEDVHALRRTYESVAHEAGISELDLHVLTNHAFASHNVNATYIAQAMPHLARCQAAIEDALWKRIEPRGRRGRRAGGRARRRASGGGDVDVDAGQAASSVVPTVRAAIQASSADRR
jgi:energy-coupling factor transporter ATP-binding protein EcfA2